MCAPGVGGRAGAAPTGRNKSLQPAPRRGGAYSGEAAGLGRLVFTGLVLCRPRWSCTGVCRIWIEFSGSVRCRRLMAAGVWWAWWAVLWLLSGDGWWQRQLRGRGSTGFVPGRCAGTRSQFSSVWTRLFYGSQSPWMAMVLLLPLDSWLATLLGYDDGRVRATVIDEDDEQGPKGLVVISVFFGVLCLSLVGQLSWMSQWCCCFVLVFVLAPFVYE